MKKNNIITNMKLIADSFFIRNGWTFINIHLILKFTNKLKGILL